MSFPPEPTPAAGRLPFLDGLRAVGMLMVVGMHAAPYCGAYETDHGAAIRFLVSTIAVPIFFVADGFLIGRAAQTDSEFDYRSFLGRSARRLLIPWLIFSLLYLAARALAETGGVVPDGLVLDASPLEILVLVWTSSVAAQMYFLPALFGTRLLAPLLRRLALLPPLAQATLVVAYAFAFWPWFGDLYRGQVDLPGLDPLLHAIWGLQYVLLGVLLARIHDVFRAVAPWVCLAGVVSIVMLQLAPGSHTALSRWAFLLAAFALFDRLGRQDGRLSQVGRETMGIYLLHTPLVMRSVDLVVERFLGASPVLHFLALWAGAFSIAYALTLAISRMPNGRVLFGEPVRRAGVTGAAAVTARTRGPREPSGSPRRR